MQWGRPVGSLWWQEASEHRKVHVPRPNPLPRVKQGFSFPKFWQTSFWLSCHPGRRFIIPVNTSRRTSLTSDFKHFLLTAGHPNVTGRLLHVTFSTPSDFLALVLNLIQLCSLTSWAENRRVSSKSKGYLKGREVSRKFQTAFLY